MRCSAPNWLFLLVGLSLHVAQQWYMLYQIQGSGFESWTKSISANYFPTDWIILTRPATIGICSTKSRVLGSNPGQNQFRPTIFLLIGSSLRVPQQQVYALPNLGFWVRILNKINFGWVRIQDKINFGQLFLTTNQVVRCFQQTEFLLILQCNFKFLLPYNFSYSVLILKICILGIFTS